MSAKDVTDFFDEYVFGFIAGDIQREIDTARGGSPAGNFLAALGLLCYTEVLGGVRRGTVASGQSANNFDTFFRELGPAYGSLLDGGLNAYGVFRCGMAHEYLVKGTATITMLKGAESAGIAMDRATGRYFFAVERYFEDFVRAAAILRADLLATPSPALPKELSGRM